MASSAPQQWERAKCKGIRRNHIAPFARQSATKGLQTYPSASGERCETSGCEVSCPLRFALAGSHVACSCSACGHCYVMVCLTALCTTHLLRERVRREIDALPLEGQPTWLRGCTDAVREAEEAGGAHGELRSVYLGGREARRVDALAHDKDHREHSRPYCRPGGRKPRALDDDDAWAPGARPGRGTGPRSEQGGAADHLPRHRRRSPPAARVWLATIRRTVSFFVLASPPEHRRGPSFLSLAPFAVLRRPPPPPAPSVAVLPRRRPVLPHARRQDGAQCPFSLCSRIVHPLARKWALPPCSSGLKPCRRPSAFPSPLFAVFRCLRIVDTSRSPSVVAGFIPRASATSRLRGSDASSIKFSHPALPAINYRLSGETGGS